MPFPLRDRELRRRHMLNSGWPTLSLISFDQADVTMPTSLSGSGNVVQVGGQLAAVPIRPAKELEYFSRLLRLVRVLVDENKRRGSNRPSIIARLIRQRDSKAWSGRPVGVRCGGLERLVLRSRKLTRLISEKRKGYATLLRVSILDIASCTPLLVQGTFPFWVGETSPGRIRAVRQPAPRPARQVQPNRCQGARFHTANKGSTPISLYNSYI